MCFLSFNFCSKLFTILYLLDFYIEIVIKQLVNGEGMIKHKRIQNEILHKVNIPSTTHSRRQPLTLICPILTNIDCLFFIFSEIYNACTSNPFVFSQKHSIHRDICPFFPDEWPVVKYKYKYGRLFFIIYVNQLPISFQSFHIFSTYAPNY